MVLSPTHFRFGDFRLDAAGRQLWRGEERVELSGRYLDALVLLVREHGQLLSKERLFEEVWSGVIVSDSALTQCIKEIRKQLGDDAGEPRFVQTVPRYGYRFIGVVEVMEAPQATRSAVPVAEDGTMFTRHERRPLERAIREGLAGTLGGGVAGLVGGLFYGLVMTSGGHQESVGTTSTLAVLLSLGVFLGMAGGFGVSAGMSLAALYGKGRNHWIMVGAALGGALIGGVADVLGLDAFNLLFGRSVHGITGALEGGLLGAALAGGAWLGGGIRAQPRWRPLLGASMAATLVGVLIPLAGGHLFAGSLNSLADAFAGSRLQLEALGGLFGDAQLGPTTQAVLGGIEVLLFAVCVVSGIVLAERVRDISAERMR